MSVRFVLLLSLALLFAAAPLPLHAQDAPDPCMTTCCAAGWSFYGEGNFSKLGVNGSSNCNCFDSPITACPKMQPAAMMMRSARGQLLSEAQQQRRLEDSQCQPACCAVGHTYYGYGDYSRLGNCNCVTTAAVLCGNVNIDTLRAEGDDQPQQRKQRQQRQRRNEDRLVEQQ